MALVALIFVFGLTLFNLGGVTPGAGTGEAYESESTQNGVTLRVKSLQPLVISGRGFKAREHVLVTGAGRKSVTATRAGRFTVRMGSPRCAGFTIVARGSAGSRGTLNFANLSSVHCLD
ncbi:MAG: hypothetical protein ACXW0F_11910 [Gaiellaceae bacterium]